MDSETQRVVERLHASPTMAVLAVAGAGAESLTWLLREQGASRTVLEVLVPYSSASLAEFIGGEPKRYVSSQTAADMSRAAYRRAALLREHDGPVVGVGCTAAIATDRARRGGHRCHVAAWRQDGMTLYNLELVKGLRDRAEEDRLASKLVLRALCEASHVAFDLPLGLEEGERVEVQSVQYSDLIHALLADHVGTVTVRRDGTMIADGASRGGVLSGSFDPLHAAHERLAAAASEILGADVWFELSVTNVDKPTLGESEVLRRVAQFAGTSDVVVTRAVVFQQKARLFPGCTFVIGWDTAVRLVAPRYYGCNESTMMAALHDMRRLGCRFLVAGRLAGDSFRTLDDVALPRGFEDMFTPVPESVFRCDVSSTELRLARTNG